MAAPTRPPSWHLSFHLQYTGADLAGTCRRRLEACSAAPHPLALSFITRLGSGLNSDTFGFSKGVFQGKKEHTPRNTCCCPLPLKFRRRASPLPGCRSYSSPCPTHSGEGCGFKPAPVIPVCFSPAFRQTESLCSNLHLHLIICWQPAAVQD